MALRRIRQDHVGRSGEESEVSEKTSGLRAICGASGRRRDESMGSGLSPRFSRCCGGSRRHTTAIEVYAPRGYELKGLWIDPVFLHEYAGR